MLSRARIHEVAKAAGVSQKTVSRVLNNEPNVRDETRERVMKVAREMNYRPHPSARSLAGHRSYVIALLYDNPSNNYVMEIISGVLDACNEAGYHLVLAPISYTLENFEPAISQLISHSRPDGLILTPPLTDVVAVTELLKLENLPYSSVSPKDIDVGVGVTLDERHAAIDITTHLIELGHRRIGLIKGHPAHGASAWRLAGYKQALVMHGIDYDPQLVVDGEFSFDSGMRAARQLLALPQRPTAVFASNDDMAAGVIRVAAEMGLRVPAELSVCGFDDTPMSRQIVPALTTVRQPSRRMGQIAATQLLAKVLHKGVGTMINVPYEILLRDSTSRSPT